MPNYQQFVDDYMMVVQNDQEAWLHHESIAQQEDNNVYGIADRLRDDFESSISNLLDKLDPSHVNYHVNIMREMLIGWGSTPYENIAREVLAQLDEGE